MLNTPFGGLEDMLEVEKKREAPTVMCEPLRIQRQAVTPVPLRMSVLAQKQLAPR